MRKAGYEPPRQPRICALLLSSSCSDDANPGERAYKLVGYDPVGYAANTPDSTVNSFLKWYRKHEDHVCRIDFIKAGLEDKTTFYHIDFSAGERCLHELRKSGLLP